MRLRGDFTARYVLVYVAPGRMSLAFWPVLGFDSFIGRRQAPSGNFSESRRLVAVLINMGGSVSIGIRGGLCFFRWPAPLTRRRVGPRLMPGASSRPMTEIRRGVRRCCRRD